MSGETWNSSIFLGLFSIQKCIHFGKMAKLNKSVQTKWENGAKFHADKAKIKCAGAKIMAT